ncbi:MAG: hypothetical protein Q7R85_02090 [bacterium]|nr:hypothetical protein [bacterium]
MILQPSGILPAWVEDGDPCPLSFTESAGEGDWVLNIIPPGKGNPDDVRAGRVQFCHHKNDDRIRAQCLYMFGSAEPFLWRFWFADPDGRDSEFEWMVRFGGKWWWVPLREITSDTDSPHSIRFHVMVDTATHGGLPWRAKKVFVIVLNNHGKLLYREVFVNPDSV